MRNEHAQIPGHCSCLLFCDFPFSSEVRLRARSCFRHRCPQRSRSALRGVACIPAAATRASLAESALCFCGATPYSSGRNLHASPRASLRLRLPGRELVCHSCVSRARRKLISSWRATLHASRVSRRLRLASARLQRPLHPAIVHGSVSNHAGLRRIGIPKQRGRFDHPAALLLAARVQPHHSPQRRGPLQSGWLGRLD